MQLLIRESNVGGIVKNHVPISEAVLQSSASGPVISIKNLNFRCDKSDATIVNSVPWNWDLDYGDRLSILTPNRFIRNQLISVLADLVKPFKGEVEKFGVVGWPVGVQAGLSTKIRVFHAIDFLREVYGDCLIHSRFPIEEFWQLLAVQSIEKRSILSDLSKIQKDFFYHALSVLFLFDVYLIADPKFLMSKSAKPIKEFFHLQLSDSHSLLTTTANDRFRKEFCNKGLVIGAMGEILFSGNYQDSIEWYNSNLANKPMVDQDDSPFVIGSDLQDVVASDQADQNDDF